MSGDQGIDFYDLKRQLGNDTPAATEVAAVDDRVKCPYNFVPCPDRIVEIADGHQISQDVPFRDGIGGHLELNIETHSPIFIPDPDRKEHFFSLPGGEAAIPATSLRGMLRSTLEIASFGRMNPVNDHRFPLRDLTGPAKDIYRKPMMMVSAGWLVEDRSSKYPELGTYRWQIEPVHWAKVSYDLLEKRFPSVKFGLRQSSMDKYRQFKEIDLQLQATVKTMEEAGSDDTYRRLSHVGVVQELLNANESGESGTLVMTGQPQPYDSKNPWDKKEKKKNDFFFHGNAGPAMPISHEVRSAFSIAHSNSGEQHRLDQKPNKEWGYWSQQMKKGRKVPVFFLSNKDGQVVALGLARMFRLAGKLSVTSAAANAQGQLAEDRFDMAEAIFGRVQKQAAVRGRVRIGPGRVQSSGATEASSRTVIMGGPKPKFHPFYLQQDGGLPDTWLDPGAKAAGWKRYQVREVPWNPPLPPGANVNMKNVLHPLEAGVSFCSRVHLHNLRPFELGALLWSLDFGGRDHCYHTLGRGRPYGLGKVQLKVDSSRLRDVHGNSLSPEALDQCRDEFRRFMEANCGGSWGEWEGSKTVRELVATATAFPPEHEEMLRYMEMMEYQDAKKESRTLAPSSSRLKQAGISIPLPQVVSRPEGTTAVEETEEEKETVLASGAAAEYQEAWDSRGFKGVSQLANDWMTDSGSEETIERKKVIEKWTLGLSRQKKSKIQDIIDWCKK